MDRVIPKKKKKNPDVGFTEQCTWNTVLALHVNNASI